MCEKLVKIGHSACPPYHLKIVLGGLSHLQNSQFLTLATVDEYAWTKDENLKTVRDKDLEAEIQTLLKQSDLGAQGKGKFFLMPDGLKIFRVPRHAAHFFVGIGVSCSAHRTQRFKINESGVFLEKLCKEPELFLEKKPKSEEAQSLKINLNEDPNVVLKNFVLLNPVRLFYFRGNYWELGTKLMLDGFGILKKIKRFPSI